MNNNVLKFIKNKILSKENLIVHFPFDKDIIDSCSHKNYSNTGNQIVDTTNLSDKNNYNFSSALLLKNTSDQSASDPTITLTPNLENPSIFAVDFYYYIPEDAVITKEWNFLFVLAYIGDYEKSKTYPIPYYEQCWVQKFKNNKEYLSFGGTIYRINMELERNQWNHVQYIYILYENGLLNTEFDQFVIHNDNNYFEYKDYKTNFSTTIISSLTIGRYSFTPKCYIRDFKIYYKHKKSFKDKIKNWSLNLFTKN